MSVGVAVVLKSQFGRPTSHDRLIEQEGWDLPFQQNENEAGVYGLVPKPRYIDKPRNDDYDSAFHQFKEDFKKRNFKYLICSSIGCVRDEVELKHFISNIQSFQASTGKYVKIICYGQKSTRQLFNKLEYKDFLSKIQNIISGIKKSVSVQCVSEKQSNSVCAPPESGCLDVLTASTPSPPTQSQPLTLDPGLSSPSFHGFTPNCSFLE